MRKIEKIVVHASATSPSAAHVDAAEIRRWHTAPPRNWSDIGYHYVIKRDGVVEMGRPEDVPGAHVAGYNRRSIGICMAGGVNEQGAPDANFTRAQYTALNRLLHGLTSKYSGAEVMGHRDVPGVAKACPCFDVRAWWGGGYAA
ncbi:MAG: N-acetylmuramoyl-L-alanine amidase [Rhodospirillaceae bacterium]|nr:N-acetylmuramoyl-L-alanine amidase [Rhodospirillaceae bacterium]